MSTTHLPAPANPAGTEVQDKRGGGPAFPRPETDYNYGAEGMSLRAWFAGQALKMLGPSMAVSTQDAGTMDERANWCCAQADALIAALERNG